MPTTPRLQLVYPERNDSSWMSTFEALVEGIDAALYANREDRNLVFTGGGNVKFTSATGVLSWSADISVMSANTGYYSVIPAGSIHLDDGQLAYITLTRGLTQSVQISVLKGPQVPNAPRGDDSLFFVLRKGNVCHFRDTTILNPNVDTQIFETAPTGGTGSSGYLVGFITAAATIDQAVTTLALVSTSVGSYTVMLPASPPAGTLITVADHTGSAATHAFTINGNGHNINITGTHTYVVSVAYQTLTLVYSGSTWVVI